MTFWITGSSLQQSRKTESLVSQIYFFFSDIQYFKVHFQNSLKLFFFWFIVRFSISTIFFFPPSFSWRFNRSSFYYAPVKIWWFRQWRIFLQCKRPGFYPCVGKIPWRRNWQATPVLLPGEFQGQRSLAGYSLWDRTTEGLTFTFS